MPRALSDGESQGAHRGRAPKPPRAGRVGGRRLPASPGHLVPVEREPRQRGRMPLDLLEMAGVAVQAEGVEAAAAAVVRAAWCRRPRDERREPARF